MSPRGWKKSEQEQDVRPTFVQGEKRKYTRKPRITITADSVDMEGLSDEQRKGLLANLMRNEQVAEDLGETLRTKQDSGFDEHLIQDKHIDFFLDVIQGVERVMIPRMIARKSVFGMPAGKFQIEPQVAAKCFTFTQEQRYGKDGQEGIVQPAVEACNKSLPPKIKALIAKVGPGSIAVQRLMQALMQQQASAIAMQVGIYNSRAQKPNGHAQPASVQSQAQPAQPSQDISAPTA